MKEGFSAKVATLFFSITKLLSSCLYYFQSYANHLHKAISLEIKTLCKSQEILQSMVKVFSAKSRANLLPFTYAVLCFA